MKPVGRIFSFVTWWCSLHHENFDREKTFHDEARESERSVVNAVRLLRQGKLNPDSAVKPNPAGSEVRSCSSEGVRL